MHQQQRKASGSPTDAATVAYPVVMTNGVGSADPDLSRPDVCMFCMAGSSGGVGRGGGRLDILLTCKDCGTKGEST